MSLFDLPKSDSGSRRYFVPRHLDAPLIVDGLATEIHEAMEEYRVKPVTHHLRRLLEEAAITSPIASKLARRSTTTLRSNYTVTMITPYEVILVAISASTGEPYDDRPDAVAQAQATIVKDFMRDRGIPADLSFKLMDDTKDLIRRTTHLESPQRILVSKRAAGNRSSIIHDLVTDISTRIILSDKYVLYVDDHRSTIRVGTYDIYLSSLDILRRRSRTMIGSDVLYPSNDLKWRIRRQWKWQERWIRKYGNRGYNLSKLTESLGKARLAKKVDSILGEKGPYEKMWTKLLSKVVKYEIDPDTAAAVVKESRDDYDEYTAGCSIQDLVELFGLQKNVGYPFIYAVNGGLSAAKEALAPQFSDWKACTDLRAAWMSRFCVGYIQKERRWPTLYFPPGHEATLLSKWYHSGYLNIQLSDFVLSDWDGVLPGKLFDFNYHDNYLQLMDDKAISFNRDELDAYWDHTKKTSTSRRLLLEIMTAEGFSFYSLVEMVENNAVPWKYKVVCMWPKECEQKPEARMFAIMNMYMRTLFAGVEANIAQHVFPYISSQTMTKDKISIQNLFYNLTSAESSNDAIHVFIECDLSRWNLHWRARTVNLIGTDLNLMFGTTEVFTYIHHFFNSSLMTVRTPKLRPVGIETGNPTLGPLAWVKHQAGMEGIGQKLWSIATFAMVDVGMFTQLCSYTLIGQGDNQILSVLYPRDHSVTVEQQYFRDTNNTAKALEKACADVGQDLKWEECLEMRNMITYSKEVWVNGIQYFTSLKFASRISAQTSSIIPLFSLEIAGLHSSILACAESCARPLLLTLLAAYYQSAEIISRAAEDHPEWGRVSDVIKRRLSEGRVHDMIKLLWLPSYLGGLSTSSVADFLHRGDSDPLSEQIGVMLIGASVSSIVAPLVRLLNSPSTYDPDPDASRLLQDPYCLPTKVIPGCSGKLNSLVNAYLSRQCKNPDVKALVTPASIKYAESLKQTLLSMTPFYPVICRDLFDYSAAGEAQKLSKMFTTTQTIQRASREAGYDGTSSIVEASGLEIAFTVDKILSVPATSALFRHVTSKDQWIARDLRKKWGKVGVIPEGISTVSPIYSEVKVSFCPSEDSAIKICVLGKENIRESRGPYMPYLGAATKIERSQHGYRIMGDSQVAVALRRLQTIRSIPHLSESVKQLIDEIASSRCEITTGLESLGGDILSSNIEHRYHGRETNRGSYAVGTGNVLTHSFLNSNELKGVSGSREDYPIFFQAWYTLLGGYLNEYTYCVGQVPQYFEIMISPDVSSLEPIGAFQGVIQNNELEPSPAEFKSSKIVFDNSVWKLEHSGPQPIKGILRLTDSTTLDDDSLIDSAVLAVLSRSGYQLGGSDLILDGAIGATRNIELDLAEILSLTAHRIVIIASFFIALEIGHRFISELLGRGTVGRVEYYEHRLCTSVSRSLSVLFQNPQLHRDQLISTLGYKSEFKFDPSGWKPQQRLYALCRSLSNKIRTVGRLQSIVILVYQSERSGRSADVMMSLIGLALMRSQFDGTSWTAVSALGQLPSLTSAQVEPHQGLKHLLLKRSVTTMLATTRLSRASRQLLRNLRDGNMIVLVSSDHRSMIRLARSIPPPPVVDDSTLNIQKEVVHESDCASICTCKFCRSEDHSGTSVSYSTMWRLSYPTIRGSAHLASWIYLLQSLSPSNITLVGVGIGVAVQAAWESGHKRVTGYDLLDRYTLTSIRDNLQPSHVSSKVPRSFYKWGYEMFQYRTGWSDPQFRETIGKAIGDNDYLIVDVQPYRHPLITLREISDVIVCGTAIVRVVCSLSDGLSWSTEVLRNYSTCRIVRVRSLNACNLFFVIKKQDLVCRIPSLNISAVAPLIPPMIFVQFNYCDLVQIAAEWADDFSVSIYGMKLAMLDPKARARQIQSQFSRHFNRPSYKDWTIELSKLRIIEFCLAGDISVQSLIDLMESRSFTVHNLKGEPVEILYVKHLHHLCRLYGAPLHWYAMNLPDLPSIRRLIPNSHST